MTEVFQDYGPGWASSTTWRNGAIVKVTTWEPGVANSTRTMVFV